MISTASVYFPQHLNDYFGLDFKWSDKDYLVLDEHLTKTDLDRIIYNPVPFCRYCNMKNQTTFEWGISQKSVNEWIAI